MPRCARAALLVAILLSSLFPSSGCRASGTTPEVGSHRLEVILDMTGRSLQGRSVLDVARDGADKLTLFLAPQSAIHTIRVNDATADFDFSSGQLVIDIGAVDQPSASVSVEVIWQARFTDPFPDRPVVTDNPGYGVSGTITADAAFLLAGSGWYPRHNGPQPEIHLFVTAPLGLLGVTAGSLVRHEHLDQRTVSEWHIDHPVEGLSLSVGRYEYRFREIDTTTVATYFFPQSNPLSQDYLDAVARYISLYSDLHGPYPFPKFAVVENFFPTGYGFPSYTLIGTRVLRLPFIIPTSLRHEVAHSWWGNGVLVAADGGNWCEGLATYVADYMGREEESEAAAREYRMQILRDFALLAPPERDFPLQQFTHRTNPASRAVGYGKSAFCYHMLRQQAGDDRFRQGLRSLYAQKLFSPAGWMDVLTAIAAAAPEVDAVSFHAQWIARAGAPVLRLADVVREKKDGKWTVSGRLIQESPFYDLTVPLLLETQGMPVRTKLDLSGGSIPFALSSGDAPLRLIVDPDIDVFRRLATEEIPLTVNSLKGADALTAVLSPRFPEQAARMLLAGLNHPRATMLFEEDLDAVHVARSNTLFLGVPATTAGRKLLGTLPDGFVLDGETLRPPSMPDTGQADTFFMTLPDPVGSGRIRALIASVPGTNAAAIQEAARKITHYGKYSLLAFAQGTNVHKATRRPQKSPLVHRFEEDAS